MTCASRLYASASPCVFSSSLTFYRVTLSWPANSTTCAIVVFLMSFLSFLHAIDKDRDEEDRSDCDRHHAAQRSYRSTEMQ